MQVMFIERLLVLLFAATRLAESLPIYANIGLPHLAAATSTIAGLYYRAPTCIATSVVNLGVSFMTLSPWVHAPLSAATELVCGLPAAGFTSAGVKAGSTAAAKQSAIGNVSADTLFSWLQSFGARLR